MKTYGSTAVTKSDASRPNWRNLFRIRPKKPYR